MGGFILKQFLLFISIISFLFVINGCKEEDENVTTIESTTTTEETSQVEVYKYTYEQLGPNTMPIGAWSDPPPANFAGVYDNPDLVNNEQYRLIHEAGLNVIYGLYNNAELNLDGVLKSLDYAAQNDVVYLVRDHQVTGSYSDEDLQYLQDAIDRYKEKSAFGGVMVIDEPGVISYNNLGNLHKNFKDLLPNKTFYINLLPTYASKNQLVNGAGGGNMNDDSMTYGRYIDEYITLVKPKFISYDFYPFTGLQFGQMRGGYFEQMSLIKEKADEAKIPYWVFIQASSWSPSSLRVPNDIEIQWQVSTALAYGAKGIQYFMYYTSMEQHSESFVGGMVDVNGNKNPMYDYVQKANRQIAAVDHILMNAKHMGVIVNGESPDAIPQTDQITQYENLTSVSGDDALIGCFNYQGKAAYYVVNNSLTNTLGEITLNFSSSVTVNTYQNGSESETSGENISLSIPAGEGVLIEIK